MPDVKIVSKHVTVDMLTLACAARYAIHRQSYANAAVARELHRVAPDLRRVDPSMATTIARDIREELAEQAIRKPIHNADHWAVVADRLEGR